MYRLAVFTFGFLSLLLSFSLGDAHVIRKRHFGRALAPNQTDEIPTVLQEHKKRANNRMSFYVPGLGACGNVNGPNDYIVALNRETFDTGSYCGKSITISFNGKTAQATIVDRCEECTGTGIDLSPGLFNFFASPDAGIIYGSYTINDGSPPPPPPSPSPPPPSSTSTSTSTTSTSTSTTASSTSASTSDTSSSSSTSTSTSSSAGASATPSDRASAPGNLVLFSQGLYGLAYVLTLGGM